MTTLPELLEIQRLKDLATSLVKFKTIETISYNGKKYPIEALILGPDDKSFPTVGLFGGVHGLERIGSQVILAFLHSLFQELRWDKDLNHALSNFRIVSIPVINPGGMARYSRSNPNNVDLMRNAPVEAHGKLMPLVSGHRLSPHLPWYRGVDGILEKESEALISFVREEMFQSQMSVALDVHSGFGVQDQIWYPYARQVGGFPKEELALKLKKLMDDTYPHHIYKFEAQALNYITHGDLWDHMFDLHEKEFAQNTFLPLTLELGSWNWIRKNPLQFFSKEGFFHPMKQHRHSRIMRRHLVFLRFLLRAVKNHERWT